MAVWGNDWLQLLSASDILKGLLVSVNILISVLTHDLPCYCLQGVAFNELMTRNATSPNKE